MCVFFAVCGRRRSSTFGHCRSKCEISEWDVTWKSLQSSKTRSYRVVLCCAVSYHREWNFEILFINPYFVLLTSSNFSRSDHIPDFAFTSRQSPHSINRKESWKSTRWVCTGYTRSRMMLICCARNVSFSIALLSKIRWERNSNSLRRWKMWNVHWISNLL